MKFGRTARPPAMRERGDVLVEARGVSARLGGVEILHRVDLAVRSGEVVGLAGPNGAGKSTLFGVLCGDIAASGGSVSLHGEPLESWSLLERAQRRSVLPQQVTVSFPFLVRDVVAMGRAPWSGSETRDEDEEWVNAALADMDLTALAARRFTSLSGGEKARVAFARVLAQRCQLMLLDEPTAALDIRHQEVLLQVVRAQAAEGAGAIVVLHDLALAAAYADRIVVLSDGRVAGEGPPAEVLKATLLSEVYGHPIDVHRHPGTGAALVTPRRG